MSEDIVRAGKIRLQIYTMVKEMLGRDITEKEHAMLKVILEDFRRTVAPQIQNNPIEHTYVCLKCGGKQVGYGKRFHLKMKNIKPPKPELLGADSQN